MKITKKEGGSALLPKIGHDPDIYDARLSHAMVTLIDRNEFIVDILPRACLRYVMSEADELIDAIVAHWPDARKDPYYRQGYAIFPICAPDPERVRKDVDIYKYSKDITMYRYQLAGEWIYGITNRCDPDEPPTRYIEASLDGWERWRRDHKRALTQVWQAWYN